MNYYLKKIFIVFLFVASFSTVVAQDKISWPSVGELRDSYDESVKAAIAEFNETNKISEETLATLKDGIHGFGLPVSIHKAPKEMVQDVRERLEPIKPYLLQIAKSDDELEQYYAASLLPYVPQDQQAVEVMHELVDSKNRGAVANVLDYLFNSNLASDELKEEVVGWLDEKPTRTKPSNYGIAVQNVGEWKLEAALPKLIDMLKESDRATGRIAALKQIKWYRGKAAEYLPEIMALYEKRKLDEGMDFREREAFDFAIELISKGLEQAELNEQVIEEVEAIVPVIIEKTVETLPVVEKPEETPKPVGAIEIEQPAEKLSNWLMWIILLIAAVVVVAFVSRKKKS